jgi:Protein of unknown function (DUF3572)
MIGHGSADLLRKGKHLPMKTRGSVTPEAAEGLAIQALTFIAGDGERLGRFLAVTGIGPSEIRATSREPRFLAGVLEYLASDEKLAAAFALDAGCHPSDIAKAHVALGGEAWEREIP